MTYPNLSTKDKEINTVSIRKEELLDLKYVATSESSILLRKKITELSHYHSGNTKPPCKRLREAATTIVADLLHCHTACPYLYRYRSVGGSAFIDERIGYTVFKRVFDALSAHELIDVIHAKKGGEGGYGTATRLRATAKLVALAQRHGIELDKLADHYGRCPPPRSIKEPVVMRGPATKKEQQRHQGPKLKLDRGHLHIQLDIKRINKLNAFLADADISGANHRLLKRIYCDTGDTSKYGRYGGRLYGLYQNTKKKKRRLLCNGEPMIEIDISASFLTIYHSLIGKPIDTSRDPYECIAMNRAVVKAYINAGMGLGKLHDRWPDDVVDALENPEDESVEPIPNVRKNYPIGRVRMAVVDAYPALGDMAFSGISWGDLHYAESNVVLATLEALAFDHNVAALPLHDALFVPASKAALAMSLLSAEFEEQIGVKPLLKLKRVPDVGSLAA